VRSRGTLRLKRRVGLGRRAVTDYMSRRGLAGGRDIMFNCVKLGHIGRFNAPACGNRYVNALRESDSGGDRRNTDMDGRRCLKSQDGSPGCGRSDGQGDRPAARRHLRHRREGPRHFRARDPQCVERTSDQPRGPLEPARELGPGLARSRRPESRPSGPIPPTEPLS
jgi:hypothetical protein